MKVPREVLGGSDASSIQLWRGQRLVEEESKKLYHWTVILLRQKPEQLDVRTHLQQHQGSPKMTMEEKLLWTRRPHEGDWVTLQHGGSLE